MRSLKAAFSTSLPTWMTFDKKLPEPEPFVCKPRAMTGFLATLTDEQRKQALDYRGPETHGDKAFAR